MALLVLPEYSEWLQQKKGSEILPPAPLADLPQKIPDSYPGNRDNIHDFCS